MFSPLGQRAVERRREGDDVPEMCKGCDDRVVPLELDDVLVFYSFYPNLQSEENNVETSGVNVRYSRERTIPHEGTPGRANTFLQ